MPVGRKVQGHFCVVRVVAARKNKPGAGRPGHYKTPAELQTAIDKYFDYCDEHEEIPNIAGLRYHLDMCYESAIHDQEKRSKEFSKTIKKMRDRMYDYKMQAAVAGKMDRTIFIFDAVNNHNMFNTRTESKNSNDVKVSGSLDMLYKEITNTTPTLPELEE